MKHKTTEDLLRQLENTSSIKDYLSKQKRHLIEPDISQYLNRKLEQSGLSKAEVIRNSEINEIYGYQIFSGLRHPSRDKLICLCIGMHLNLDDVNNTLRYLGEATLYARNKRDSILIWGINSELSVPKINEQLYEQGLQTL